MLPYVEYHVIPIGPLTLQVWGLFVAAGIVVGTLLAAREAKRAGLDPKVMHDLAVWALVPALLVARVFHVLFYDIGRYLADPLAVFRIWEGGMSSFGGFLGAALGIWLYVRRRKMSRALVGAYLRVGAFALPLGYGIGRIGCFMIHDHIGIPCDCALAVDFPDGARLDHGLLLSLTGFGIFGIFLILRHMAGKQGKVVPFFPLLLLLYGGTRFFLDFYRAYDIALADARYLSLTPAQYGSLAMVSIAIVLLYRERKATTAV